MDETTLRLLRAHLEAASALIDGLMPADQRPAPPDEPAELVCPNCGERREAKFEEFQQADEGGHLSARVACLNCGKSFTPMAEEVAHG